MRISSKLAKSGATNDGGKFVDGVGPDLAGMSGGFHVGKLRSVSNSETIHSVSNNTNKWDKV